MKLSVATVLFAAIVAALIAIPTRPYQGQPIVTARTEQLSVPAPGSRCAQQNWPNFDAACLRYTDDKQAVRDIRIAVGNPG